MTKKTLAFPAAFVVLSLLVFAVYQTQMSNTPKVVTETAPGVTQVVTQTVDQTPKLTTFVTQALSEKTSQSLAADPTNQECRAQSKRVVEISIDQNLKALTEGSFVMTEACWPTIEGSPSDPCRRLITNSDQPYFPAACRAYLVSARALNIGLRAQSQTNYDSMDIEVLVAKIIAEIRTVQGKTPAQRIEWRKMTAAFMKREPSSLEALKAHLLTYTADVSSDQLTAIPELPTLALQGIKMNPKDSQFHELHLFLLSQQTGSRERIEEHVQQYPEISEGYYYLAAEFWKKRDATKASELLSKAMALDPVNRRYTDAQRLVQPRVPASTDSASESDPSVFEREYFQSNIGFSFQNI